MFIKINQWRMGGKSDGLFYSIFFLGNQIVSQGCDSLLETLFILLQMFCEDKIRSLWLADGDYRFSGLRAQCMKFLSQISDKYETFGKCNWSPRCRYIVTWRDLLHLLRRTVSAQVLLAHMPWPDCTLPCKQPPDEGDIPAQQVWGHLAFLYLSCFVHIIHIILHIRVIQHSFCQNTFLIMGSRFCPINKLTVICCPNDWFLFGFNTLDFWVLIPEIKRIKFVQWGESDISANYGSCHFEENNWHCSLGLGSFKCSNLNNKQLTSPTESNGQTYVSAAPLCSTLIWFGWRTVMFMR